MGASAAVLAGASRPAVLHESGEITGSGRVVVLEPDTWVGKRLPLLAHIDIGPELGQGDWLVVLYRRDCRKCHALLERLEVESRFMGDGGTLVAVVEVGDYPEVEQVERQFAPWASPGRLDPQYRWHVSTPAVLHVVNDQVVGVDNGSVTVPGAPRESGVRGGT
jgi:hypothetical protein